MNSRRTFLRKSILATASLPFLSMDFPYRQTVPYLDTIGLQLYTVRDQLAEDPVLTLRTIKELGYHQVELLDIEGAAEHIQICRDLDLKVNGSFINWNHLTGGWHLVGQEKPEKGFEHLLELAEQYELEYLVFGYMRPEERGTLDQWNRHIEVLNDAGEQCKSAGLQLAYHNHAFEFEPIQGVIPYNLLVEKLDPDLVKFELDIFWASLAGIDPLPLIESMGNRTYLLHLKDKRKRTPVIYQESDVPKKAFKELGEGTIDILACMQAGKEADVTYCHIEQDQSPNPLKSIGTSMDFLTG